MAKKGGRRAMKRYAAPRSLRVERKVHVWTTRPVPGPHTKDGSVPLRSLVRNQLRLGLTAREADFIISGGKVMVDGVQRKDPKFPVGLMDVVQMPSAGLNFRVLINRLGRLVLSGVDPSETKFKLCKVVGKKTICGGKTQLIFHDGRTLTGDLGEIRPMDVVKVELPKPRVLDRIPFQAGSVALITGGANVGMVGKISEIREITGSQPNIVTLSSGDRSFQAPEKYVFVVGTEKPIIKMLEENE
ncbi:MAG: 30S ribosomal protein S4e [Candidatus Hadarchaeales archaeon]